MPIPARLQEFLDDLQLVPDRADRIQFLISLSEQFEPPPLELAPKPYPENRRVPGCESEAFLFTRQRPDGTLDFRFAVENPQGVSAMAMAKIIQDSFSGAPCGEILEVPEEVVYDIFGRELSMGKTMGLIGMLRMAKAACGNQP